MPSRNHAVIFVAGVLACGLGLVPSPAAASTATYQLTFDATWSALTHPQNFPGNAHFSPLIGGVHSPAVSFWAEGELATLGIQRMAEWGAITPLDLEVQAAVDAGTALAMVTGPGIPSSPGQTTVTFTATDDFSRLTLVTMVAPSPDWFVGVAGLELRPGGTWAENLVITLYPYDAGTDAGVSYASPDQPQVPHVPIAAITGVPFTPGVPLGTFTLSLLTVTSVPEAPTLALRSYPNPFNPSTRVTYVAAAAGRLTLAVYDPRGRRIRTLLAGDVAAGAGAVTWDGRDDTDRRVATGTYVLRMLDTSGRTATRKVTLVE
jgi:hypothetical protein